MSKKQLHQFYIVLVTIVKWVTTSQTHSSSRLRSVVQLNFGQHIMSNLCYLICLRHLNKLRSANFFSSKYLFSFMRAQYVLSYHQNNISTMMRRRYSLCNNTNVLTIYLTRIFLELNCCQDIYVGGNCSSKKQRTYLSYF